jgi:cellulose biosynthesis protein BcsQ
MFVSEAKTLDASATDVHGDVLCFISPKGGTGKTIVAATAAYLLLKAGRRVVTIDADFSTRGLSLFMLGRILETGDLRIKPENCLADSLFAEQGSLALQPRIIDRGGLQYSVILSNRDLWQGGIPDGRFLSGMGSDLSAPLLDRYFSFLSQLCERLRREYDHVIIDTRGGYDFTSAIPAAISDGYVIVLEADMLSLDQVSGLQRGIKEFSSARKLRPSLRGFIVNKAIFSIDDKVFPEHLARSYEAKTFGVIPADREAIRAYQKKQIPADMFPECDFSYYGFKAVEQLFSPRNNWTSRVEQNRFARLGSQIKTAWAARSRAEWLIAAIPFAQLSMVAVAVIGYFIYRVSPLIPITQPLFIVLSAFVLWTTIQIGLGTLQTLRRYNRSKILRFSWAGFITALIYGVAALLWSARPTAFARQHAEVEALLRERIAEQDSLIARRQAEADDVRRHFEVVSAEQAFTMQDLQRAQAKVSDLQQQISNLQVQITTLKGTMNTQPRITHSCALVIGPSDSPYQSIDWQVDKKAQHIFAVPAGDSTSVLFPCEEGTHLITVAVTFGGAKGNSSWKQNCKHEFKVPDSTRILVNPGDKDGDCSISDTQ